jgi:hypothetical protein
MLWAAQLTSQTSVDIQLRTRQYIPEDSELEINLFCKELWEIKSVRKELDLFIISRYKQPFIHNRIFNSN